VNWGDEHYVKLYTRDSLTWRSWRWEARTVLMHLLRKVDGSGFIESGRMDPVDALVLQLELPRAVVEPGLAELLAAGTCEIADRAVLLPKFIEAQEARKTEARSKADYRAREMARRRAQERETTKGHVQTTADGGMARHPPAQPSPAQPSPDKKNAGSAKKPADPRHRVVVAALVAACPGYAFTGRDARAVTELLALGDEVEIANRWMRALRRSDYPRVRTIPELVKHWNHFASDLPPMPGKGPVDPATQRHTGGEIAL
jgi:hypothetical protein